MHILRFCFINICIFFFFSGCNNPENNSGTQIADDGAFSQQLNIEYAKGFSVKYYDGYKIVTVHEPWKNAAEPVSYLLAQEGEAIPDRPKDMQVIRIPLKSIASISTTHLPFLEMLGEHHKLTGFANPDFISSRKIRAMVDQGEVRNIGHDSSLNIEVLAELEPEVLMAYGSGTSSSSFNKIKNLGIPVVLNSDFLESSALGRAEWIKFVSLFFNKEKEADSVFNQIKENYENLKLLAANTPQKPTVYSGVVYGDIWYVPGGNSWAAELLSHAGADYLWKNTPSAGSLELSFEKVYETAAEADFWINVASYNSLQEIKASEPRYADFQAFQEGNVYTYNARVGEKGGNEYMELGYARPDIILADLIKILLPQLLPEHQLYFYRQIPSIEDTSL